MTYPDSVRFLYALGNEIKTAKLGLERIGILLAALGYPERAFRSVHVAGTNGKGSTSAMIESGLRAAGVRTGLFTSPHLIEPTELIRVDSVPVTAAQFEQAFNTVHQTAEKLNLDCHPTYFETVTAMGFWLFRELGVETAVVEAGMGGRLDATNVLNPALTVITPIDFDHEAFLGHTLESITSEKAGILKTRVPAVFARQRPEVWTVLVERAAALNVPVTRAESFEIRDFRLDARGSYFSGFHCALPGEHQAGNAIAAIQALALLGVSWESIAQGLEETRWPGRLEHVSPNPDIILDGAHNPAAARALAQYLTRFYSNRKLWIVYGAMRDKAIEEIGAILFPLASELIFTAPNYSRALRPQALADIAGRGRVASDIAAALDLIRAEASPEDAVLITGSLFLVGEARRLFVK